MEGFSISKVYMNSGCKTIDINPLPEDYCSFDCVFCPLGRTVVKSEDKFYFKETEEFISKLKGVINENEVECVFVNPDGEGLANAELIDVIRSIKEKNIKVKLLSNGYILNKEEYRETLSLCDEIIGELAVTKEKDFYKLLRPLDGYSLEEYVSNMAMFKNWFKGKFVLDITIIKNYSDSDESIEWFREVIKKISPDEVFFETPDEDRLKGAFQVTEERLQEIKKALWD
jgi:wyosine [tRNA(Phe)-imidazoG37] synthetase (radical SAM superfamily)